MPENYLKGVWWVSEGYIRDASSPQDRSIKSVQVKSSYDRSSQVRTGQVQSKQVESIWTFEQFKLSWDRLSLKGEVKDVYGPQIF